MIMSTSQECVCCCEIDATVQKMGESDSNISCIVEHEGFQPVCLDLWVLQAAYFSYRSRYGDAMEKSMHE